jgi:hypothetical protein
MTKDPDSKKYVHRYVQSEEMCGICGQRQEEHFDADHLNNGEDISLDVRSDHSPNQTRLLKSYREQQFSKQSNPEKIVDINQIIVDIPKSVLDDFEDESICRICFDNKLIDQMKICLMPCNHQFCRNCVYNHLRINIINGKVLDIPCLYGGCPKTFSSQEIPLFIDQPLYIKFKKFKHEQDLLNSDEKYMVNCPYPDCQEIVEADPTNKETFISCEKDHQFCSKCKTVGWHRKGNCKDVNFLKYF